jgi:hypothetical protein
VSDDKPKNEPMDEATRQELLAKYKDLHARAVALNERMNPPSKIKWGRVVLMLGGLAGLPTAGWFVLGVWGVLAGVALFVVAMVIALRLHEAKMRRERPQDYAPGKGYIG